MSSLVVYDHSIFTFQERGGISRYFIELAEHLALMPDLKTHIIAPLFVNRELRTHRSLSVTGHYFPKVRNTFRLLQCINNSFSGPLIRSMQPEIVHSTYYLGRYQIPDSCKKVVTVFDMIHEKYSDRMDSFEKKLPAIKKRVIESADRIICISEQTRRDVIEILGIQDEKIAVVHLASSFSASGNKALSQVEDPYFLYVGSREWPKNFNRFMKAFVSFNATKPGMRVICFGGGPFTREETELFRKLHISESQIQWCSGDDTVLQRLYSNAVALVYPSLYEGFGLPILEAMSFGCPVICSNTSSMPEVAGEAAFYFTPTVVDEIADAMHCIEGSVETKEDLVSKGLKRVQSFSWERCARETAQVYRSCLQNK